MRLFTKILSAFLFLSVGMVAFAQAPTPVMTALQQLNALTGQNYSLGNIGYEFREEVNTGTIGDCPTANQLPLNVRVYIVGFDTDFDGSFEWRFGVTSDNTATVVCQQPANVEPVQPSAPTDIPQPTATPSFCEGLTPRLAIGQTGRVMLGDPNIVRQLPDRNSGYVADIAAGTEFTITDGPRCADGFTWWQINTGTIAGWTVEGANGEYFLEIATAPVVNGGVNFTSTQEICDPQLPPRLTLGLIGAVLPGDANNLRDLPSTGGNLIGKLEGSTTFIVVDGPVCNDGLTWWQVRFGDGTGLGWTVEGASGEYFLQPSLSAFAPITGGAPLENVGAFNMGGQPAPIVSNELYFSATRGLFTNTANTTTIYQLIPNFDTPSFTLETRLGAFDSYFYDTPIGRVRTDANGNRALFALSADAVIFDQSCFVFICSVESPLNLQETLLLTLPDANLFSIASNNTLAVADVTTNSITIYSVENGTLVTLKTISLMETPRIVHFDSIGNLYVSTDIVIYNFLANTFENVFFYSVTGITKPFTLSADGRYLAYLGVSDIYVVDTANSQIIKTIPPASTGAYQVIAFSPRTPTLVAVTGNDGDANSYGIYTYDISNDRNFYQPLVSDFGNVSVVFNADGRALFVGSDKVPVSVWGAPLPVTN